MTEYLRRFRHSSVQALVYNASCCISLRLFVGSLGSSLHLFLSPFHPRSVHTICGKSSLDSGPFRLHLHDMDNTPTADHPHDIRTRSSGSLCLGLWFSLCRYITIDRTTSARPQNISTTLKQSIPTDIVGNLPGPFLFLHIYVTRILFFNLFHNRMIT